MAKLGNYQEAPFWQTRYKQNICQWYQWLASPNQLSSLLQKHIPGSSKILELGCGSSNLAQKLIALRHESVTCLDFSKEVIRHKNKNAKEGVSYKVHDITQKLPFEDQCFDVIVEKNTIDCLFCYQDYPARVMRVMKDCYRVLKEGGVMLSFSHGREKFRRFFYRNRFSPFNLEVVPVSDLKPDQTQVFLYVLTKGQVAEANEIEATGAIEEDPKEDENDGQFEAQGEKDNQQEKQQKLDMAEEDPQPKEQEDPQDENEQKIEEKQAEPQQQEYQFDELDEAS